MRVTVVSRIFRPEAGAASLRLETLCRALTDRGHEVTVLTTTPPPILRPPDDTGPVRVRRWPVLRDRSGYVRGYLQYLSFDIPALLRLLFSRRPDVVIVEPPPTTGFTMRVATAIRRLPYVYYAADIWSIAAASTGAGSLVLKVVESMERATLAGARNVLAVSDGVRDEVARLAPGSAATVVGHGVDTSVFNPDVHPLHDEIDAVYVGTASEWHGAGVLLEGLRLAAREGVRIRTAFVGSGSEIGAMRELVHAWGLEDQISFHGSVTAPEAARWLRSARFALASLRPGIGYDFAVPTKIYSALAVGTPVLYSGPDHVASVLRENDLGWGCEYTSATVAEALVRAMRSRPDAASRTRLSEWVRDNISAESVAHRGAVVVEASARQRSSNPRKAGNSVPEPDGGQND